jgi:putative Holliday junction resolvase
MVDVGGGRWENPRSDFHCPRTYHRQRPLSSTPSHTHLSHPTSAQLRLLAIDLGDRRIGLAISDPMGTIASPAGHILRRPGKRLPVNVILERAKALEAEGFVVGLPLDQNGDETERSAEARRVAELLGTRSGLTVRLLDERFTTAAAQRAIREMGGSTRGRKGDVDALAATVLLQHALQFQEHQP